MASNRLPAPRVAGIAAWTAAAVTWGTAAVALANAAPVEEAEVVALEIEPEQPQVVEQEVLEPLPVMPESGLVVLRYTPSEKPAPQVVVQRVTVAAPSSGGGSSAAPAPAPAPKKTKAKSKGS
ncbi:MAG: hypothetical protein M3132_08925 [Actinomycetia bacterium]|nr:hypothetical protein [Actinomycetes bacterium]